MQIEPNAQDQNKEGQNQVALLKPSQLWCRKVSASVYPGISIKHICNIEDAFFINEKSLRDPEHEEQSFLRTIFYFKSVAKVSVSQYYVTLHLKKRAQSSLPKQYYIERFKSYGNKEFYEIAVHLEHIAQHLKEIKQLTTKEVELNFSKQYEQKILKDSLQQLEGKKFFCFFYQFTQQGSNLNQIIISKALLNALGYDYECIAIDFLKYQEAIFEIITAKLYFLVMEKKSEMLDNVFEKMKEKVMLPEEVKKLTMFRFNDDLLPKSTKNHFQSEKTIRSRVKFSKTHPSVTIFQIEKMKKKKNFVYEPKNNIQDKFQNHKQSIQNHQYQCIKNLLKVSENQLEQNKRKTSSYRAIRGEVLQNHRNRDESNSDSEYLGFD